MGKASSIFDEVRKKGRDFMLESEAKTVCMRYGIPVTAFKVARSESEALRFADDVRYPVVLKVVSPDIIHKSDVGGVTINLKTPEEVRSAYRKILTNVRKHKSDAKIIGILIQEMAPKSIEVIVGATKDPQFGPTLMFGLGGVFVELLEDVTFRIAPITKREALEMITEVKAYPLLKGYRGQLPVDISSIVSILINTSKLVMDYPEIRELDLNPIMVYEKGARTVDARIILE
ncbi:MAG: acetate--CoA ligase family protein [Candidatus Bathyarchaeota archaeon]|nr:MAG: acetate--CoA ligase family protein [Candidatus Bathyarchaeota archaeon]